MKTNETNRSETMKAKTNIIADGIYAVHPEGCDAEYYRVRGGVIASQTAECDIETHVAARDRWACVADASWEAADDATAASLSRLLGYGDETVVERMI